MRTMRRIVLLGAVLVLGSLVYVQAQRGGSRGRGGGSAGSALERDWALVCFELYITGDQFESVRGAFMNAYGERKKVMSRMRSGGGGPQQMREEIAQIQKDLEKQYAMLFSKEQLEQLKNLKARAGSQKSPPTSGIAGVVAPGTPVELVKEGFRFTEGPVGTPDGGLYFTDIRANVIYRLDPSGGINVFRDNTAAANGLAFDRSGNLLAAEGKGKRVIRIDSRGIVAVVAAQTAGGQAFLSPNDLIVDRRGGIYFTDPGSRGHQGKTFVYYIRPDGDVLLVSDEVRLPNGLTLTQDEKMLLVADSRGNIIFGFDIQADGSVANKRPFASLQGIPDGQSSNADGMAIDSDGRLYVATVTGIQVFDANGSYLGTISVPRPPANLAFAGQDKRMLYITAREGLYRLKMLSQGPHRPGK